MSDTIIYWKPRFYYLFRNRTTGKLYLGQTTQDVNRYCGSGEHWSGHCKKNGGKNKQNIETLWCEWFTDETKAQDFLDLFLEMFPDYPHGGHGKPWANLCLETTEDNPFYDRNIAVRNSRKRLDEGTHNFQDPVVREKARQHLLGNKNPSHKRVAEGTHNFQDPLQREKLVENAKIAYAEGTHHFQSEQFKENNARVRAELLQSGKHNLLGGLTCRDKTGKVVQVPKDVYYSQQGDPTSWEFAFINSREAKKRKKQLISC